MKLEDVVYESITLYPSLFYFKGHPTLSDFEISKLSVYELLFATAGNGYVWMKEGYMLDQGDAEENEAHCWFDGERWVGEGVAYCELGFGARSFPPKSVVKPACEYTHVKERIAICPSFPFSVGEMSELYIPEAIMPDWRDGYLEFADFAIDFWSSDTSLDGDNIKPSRETKHAQIELWSDCRLPLNSK